MELLLRPLSKTAPVANVDSSFHSHNSGGCLNRLFVLGTSGLAREVAMVACVLNRAGSLWDSVAFIGRSDGDVGMDLGYGRVVGDDAWLLAQSDSADIVVGIGQPRPRAAALANYIANPAKFRFPNLIHPSVCMDERRIKLGYGNVMAAGCCLTCDITIGNFNLFNLNTTVGHDAEVGNFNVINPSVNISGNVTLGDGVLVGTGAELLERIRVGSYATVGPEQLYACLLMKAQRLSAYPPNRYTADKRARTRAWAL